MRACRCRAAMRPAPLILSRTAVVLCSSESLVTSRSRASMAASSLRPLYRSWPVSWVAEMTAESAQVQGRQLAQQGAAGLR